MPENNSLWENKLFLQLLGGAGQDISAGKPIGANVGAITQQNIRSQNMMKLLAKMLGGEVPDGGKVTMDGKGTTFNIPTSALDTASVPGEQGMTAHSISSGTSVMGPQMQEEPAKRGLGDFLNPSDSQPGISAADLAGLTTEDISQALQFGMMKEQMGQKKITDLVDMVYKTAQIQKLLAPAEVEPLDQPYPIPVPGIGKVSLRQWKSIPTDDREYYIAKWQASQLGDEEFMSKSEWLLTEPTERERFIRSALEDPKVMKGAKELARAGATRISLGEKLAEKKAFGKLKGQLYFKDPKWTSDLGKYMSSEDVQNEIFQSDTPRATRAIKSVEFIENKIIAGGGDIQEVKFADDAQKTMIWTVKWPSGDIDYIRHKIRD